MFKKALATVAVFGAFAGSASAADVNLYGIVDYGMIYQNLEKGSDSTDSFKLDSGVSSGSRFGLTGKEDLGNGYTVSFKLENGFNADDGKFGNDNRLFDREARLTIANDRFGELSFGRMGAIGSAAGTYDTVFLIGDAFDGGDNGIAAFGKTERYDNMITYRSVKAAGLQATAQYSLKLNNDEKGSLSDGEEGHDSAHRYAALAVTGEYGALEAVVSYEQIMWADIKSLRMPDDGRIVTIGANYDFGFARLFAMAQHLESAPFASFGWNDALVDGNTAHVGAQIPVAAGVLTTGVYYADADDLSSEEKVGVETLAAAVKYEYPLSKRTSLYGSVGYGVSDFDKEDNAKYTQAYVGVTHAF